MFRFKLIAQKKLLAFCAYLLIIACILLLAEHLILTGDISQRKGSIVQLSIMEKMGALETIIWLTLLCILLPLLFFISVKHDENNEMTKVRELVAKDLHDDVGSAVSSIAILSELAMKNITCSPERSSDYLEKILTGAQQISLSMEEIIWNIKPENDQFYDLEIRMRRFLADTLEPKEITCSLELDQAVKALKLNPELRRDLYLMYKECINNIAKYANATVVSIDMSHNAGLLRINIRDNGKGMDLMICGAGNGLGNIRSRAIANGGKAIISSIKSHGTQIEIVIPTTKSLLSKIIPSRVFVQPDKKEKSENMQYAVVTNIHYHVIRGILSHGRQIMNLLR